MKIQINIFQIRNKLAYSPILMWRDEIHYIVLHCTAYDTVYDDESSSMVQFSSMEIPGTCYKFILLEQNPNLIYNLSQCILFDKLYQINILKKEDQKC